jgi:hypothetical protein
MHFDIEKIIEGWRNHLIPPKHLSKLISQVSQERMHICNDCMLNSKNRIGYHTMRIDEHCTECGCTLSALTKCLSCYCESGKWKALLSSEEEDVMKKNYEE